MAYSEIEICALAERPETVSHRALLRSAWPSWVLDAQALRPQPGLVETSEAEPASTLLLWEGGTLVGSLIAKRTDLVGFPDEGWDLVQRSGPGDRLCALAVSVVPHARGRGHSRRLLQQAKARFGSFVVPVRPTSKPAGMTMDRYLERTTPEGLSQDPWLRTHQRLGGRIQGVSRSAMQLQAPWSQWEAWLGETPSAHPSLVGELVQVGELGRYSEDNVWVEHG